MQLEYGLSKLKIKFSGRMEGYNSAILRKDITAGIIVGIVAIPLSLAFAIASGVKPEYGIYTSVIAGLIVALFGGSRVQIAGPTGAFVPILLSIVLLYGYENLLIATFLSGIILLLMGITKLGVLIRFIPRPVTVGFTSGIAVIIFCGQIDTFLGLQGVLKHEYFLQNISEIGRHLHTIHMPSVIVSVICLAVLIICPKLVPALPGPFLGIIASTLVATFFFNGSVETIGSKFGEISTAFPEIRLPQITMDRINLLIGPALAITILGSIESLLSCVVSDEMTGHKHDSNKELVGQGIANIVTPMFGGIAATGAIARTATNIKNGGKTPVAGIIHSLTVLLLVFTLAPLVSRIPLASMAPILMVVAWNMSEQKQFFHLLKTTKSDALVLIITFILTILLDLTVAVGFGLLLAAALFVNRMSDTLSVEKVLPNRNLREKVTPEVVNPYHDCPQISIYTINGALFFGAVETFETTLTQCIKAKPKLLILRLGNVFVLDATAEVALEKIVETFHKEKGLVLITGLKKQPKEILRKSGLYEKLGEQNFYDRTGLAISDALLHIDSEKCLGCKHDAFYECKELSKQLAI
ncbi:SulP family inorganic anion transporter [Desulforamulus aquiferis]|uniref:SulP family inorganic anion transporter n=1 Tax=Desulforamulus aquiferis TaxID=1397668 RepID=A0AAW7Z9M7_9FIRM|nr:SulP family inorganic anion transporter [Desulforamulus aquiferis]MDO7786362.1 SulP family inorganic anion transporter [Desulforamulus aquiferis]